MNRDTDEIEELTQQLEQLRIEFQQRTDRIATRITQLREENHQNRDTLAERNTRARRPARRQPLPFDIGNIVRITNNYRYKRGTIGTVVKVTRKQVTLEETRANGYKELHTRAHHNVELVDSDDETPFRF